MLRCLMLNGLSIHEQNEIKYDLAEREYRRFIFLRILIQTPYEHSNVILSEAS